MRRLSYLQHGDIVVMLMKNDPSINWLCIQQPDGHMVIVKNVDKVLWTAIQKGDIIE